ALRLCKQGRFADARVLLLGLQRDNPRDVEVIRALATGYFDASNLRDAELYLTHWCELQPARVTPHRLRMDVFAAQGNVAQAIAAGQRVLELQPGNEEVLTRVVRMLLDDGCFPEAEQACRLGLNHKPGHVGLLARLADSCYRQGKKEEAQAILDDLMRKEPGF